MSLVSLRRRRLGRISVDWCDPDGGRIVGSEVHGAPGAPTIALTMSAAHGEFHYAVAYGGFVSSGLWLPLNHSISGLAGRNLSSDGVRLAEAERGRALLELEDARLILSRRGLTTVVASRSSDSPSPVAVFRSVARVSAPTSFVEIEPAVSRQELAMLAVAMASGTVLLLRPLARVGVVHWPFPWQRPALAGVRRRERWAAAAAQRDGRGTGIS